MPARSARRRSRRACSSSEAPMAQAPARAATNSRPVPAPYTPKTDVVRSGDTAADTHATTKKTVAARAGPRTLEPGRTSGTRQGSPTAATSGRRAFFGAQKVELVEAENT